MINIVKKELEFDNELKKKIEFICSFCNTYPDKSKKDIIIYIFEEYSKGNMQC